MKIIVLGSGAWGTALAQLLCENGHDVTIWNRAEERVQQMRNTRTNPRLKGISLHPQMQFTADISCVSENEMVVTLTLAEPDEAPYAYFDTMGIETFQVKDAKGNVVMEGFSNDAQIVDGTVILKMDASKTWWRNWMRKNRGRNFPAGTGSRRARPSSPAGAEFRR